MKWKTRFCRATALAMSALVLITSSSDALAGGDALEPSYAYTSEDEGYTFEKLSHPDKAPGTADGIVDYVGGGNVSAKDQGQGDRGQNYSWSAISYVDSDGEEWVYVGTCYNAMGNTLTLMDSALGDNFDTEVMEAGLNAMFNGTFFTSQEDGGTSRGILAKVNIKTGEVKLLMSMSTTGQGPLFRNAIEFNGKLYFCGSVAQNGAAGALPSIWEVDPENGDAIQCVHYGLKNAAEYIEAYRAGICTGIRGMAEFRDQLVISCVGVEGPYISISADPSSGEFTKIADLEDLFGYPAYHYCDSIFGGSIWEIVPYNGSLYVALCTGTPDNKPNSYSMQSFAIVRGDCNGDPGNPESWTWTSIVGDQERDGAKYTFGIDPERTRAGACNLVVYDDYLYIGEYNDVEIALEDVLFKKDFRFIAENLNQSVSLYRMDQNENIELVMGDATEMFPEGGLSGLSSGFGGSRENQYIWQMRAYQGKLYVGTFDNSSLLEPVGQFTNGDLLEMTPEEWKSQINYLKVLIQVLIEKNYPEESEPESSVEESSETPETSVEESSEVPETSAEESSDAPETSPADSTEEQEDSTEEDTTEVSETSAEESSSSVELETSPEVNSTAAPETVQDEIREPQAEAEQQVKDAVEAVAAQEPAVMAEDGTAETFTLSEEQLDTMEQELLTGEIQADSLEESSAVALMELNYQLDACTSMIDDGVTEEFAEAYAALCQSYEELKGYLPEKVIEYYQKLLQSETVVNLRSLIQCMKILSTAERGFDLYASEDGVNFTAVTTDGFGDPYNHGLRVFATTPNWMVIGTANPFYGTQLWRMAGDGTTEPDDPVDPDDPADPDDPVEPDDPADPDDPVEPDDPVGPITPEPAPETGDIGHVAGWCAVLLVSGGCMGSCIYRRRRTFGK